MTFRETIARETERRGWSAYRLGKESGVHIRTVQQYLAGTCDLVGERIAKLSAALGLELRPARKANKQAKGKV